MKQSKPANDPAASTGGTAVSPTGNCWPNGESQDIRDAADRLLKNQKH